MSKNQNKNRGLIGQSVNPEGQGPDVEFGNEISSQLEKKAKKKNTK
ncbi:small, acid-soluble spore protein L [Bacillus sp. 2205SS5-2]